MRQIVSLIKDNQVHYALVDEDDGSLIPFADIMIPEPDRFDLHSAAVLGTNLINALELNANGHRAKPKPKPVIETDLALPAPREETAKERHNRKQREAYHARKVASATSPGRGKPGQARSNTSGNGGAERYITLDEVLAVVNTSPNGITTRQIADRIYRLDGGVGDMPNWYVMSVSNRQTRAEQAYKKGVPLPYRVEYRTKLGKNGLPTQLQERVVLSLPRPTVSEPETREEVSPDA